MRTHHIYKVQPTWPMSALSRHLDKGAGHVCYTPEAPRSLSAVSRRPGWLDWVPACTAHEACLYKRCRLWANVLKFSLYTPMQWDVIGNHFDTHCQWYLPSYHVVGCEPTFETRNSFSALFISVSTPYQWIQSLLGLSAVRRQLSKRLLFGFVWKVSSL